VRTGSGDVPWPEVAGAGRQGEVSPFSTGSATRRRAREGSLCDAGADRPAEGERNTRTAWCPRRDSNPCFQKIENPEVFPYFSDSSAVRVPCLCPMKPDIGGKERESLHAVPLGSSLGSPGFGVEGVHIVMHCGTLVPAPDHPELALGSARDHLSELGATCGLPIIGVASPPGSNVWRVIPVRAAKTLTGTGSTEELPST
jgi:hypothetical protein